LPNVDTTRRDIESAVYQIIINKAKRKLGILLAALAAI